MEGRRWNCETGKRRKEARMGNGMMVITEVKRDHKEIYGGMTLKKGHKLTPTRPKAAKWYSRCPFLPLYFFL